MDDAMRNPNGDLEHAYMLLAHMSPDELLKATYALEEIVEQSPWFQEKMRKEIAEAEASGLVTTEQLLVDLGFKSEHFPGLAGSPDARDEAA